MATTQDLTDLSELPTGTHAKFGSTGTRYEFFTSEGLDTVSPFMQASIKGSTTLAHMQGSNKLSIKSLNSSILTPPAESEASPTAPDATAQPKPTPKWGVVDSEGAWWGNMTVSNFVTNPKDNEYFAYGDGLVCVSPKGNVSYKSGIVGELPLILDTSNSAALLLNAPWMHSIGWSASAPELYSKQSRSTATACANVQSIFPKVKSPRWFRRAGVQRVDSTEHGSRDFFIYTDLLGTFYVYAAYIPKEIPEVPANPNGNPPTEATPAVPILVQYKKTNSWTVPSEFYKTATPEWGDAAPPTVDSFYGYQTLKVEQNPEYSDAMLSWTGEFPKDSNNLPEFNSFMGGDESSFASARNLTTNQYVWSFNYNSTKATTIAFKKGSALKFKNLAGDKSSMYKFRGLPFAFPQWVNDNKTTNTLLQGLKEEPHTKMEEICEYYPVLLEVSLTITVTGANLQDFSFSLSTIQNKSSLLTNEYYLGSGYTAPTFDKSTKKLTSSGDLSYLWLTCHSKLTNYESGESPCDTTWVKQKDDLAHQDLPSTFNKNSDKDFMDMLISGDYTTTTIRTFVEGIEGVTYAKDGGISLIDSCTEIMDAFSLDIDAVLRVGHPKSKDKGKEAIGYGLFNTEVYIQWSELQAGFDGMQPWMVSAAKLNVLKFITDQPEYQTTWYYAYKNYSITSYWIKNLYTKTTSAINPSIAWDASTGSSNGYKLAKYVNTISNGKTDKLGLKKYPDGTVIPYRAIYLAQKYSKCVDTIIRYAAILPSIFNMGVVNQNIYPKGYTSNSAKDDPFKCFKYLLLKHVDKTQVLTDIVASNIDEITGMCLFVLIDKVFENVTYVRKADIDIIKYLAASLLKDMPDAYVFNNNSEVGAAISGYLDTLPRFNCQVIDGVLVSNTEMKGYAYPKSGDDSIQIETAKAKPKVYMREDIYRRNDYLFIKQSSSNSNYGRAFGKKMDDFKCGLNVTINSNVVKRFTLLDSPYAAVNPISTFLPSIGIPYYKKGDAQPYATLNYLPKATDGTSSEPTTEKIMKDLGYLKYPPQVSVVAYPDSAINPYKFRTNSVTFGLFVKANNTTRCNTLAAFDYATTTALLFSSIANPNYSTYDVGIGLYFKDSDKKVFGSAVNKPADTEVSGDTLDIKRFNMVYALMAKIHTTADIPIPKSLTKCNKLYDINPQVAYNDAHHFIIADDEDREGNALELYSRASFEASITLAPVDTHNNSSFVVSHPNGSMAAYSLPPLGFLRSDLRTTTPYKPTYIVDYVKVLKNPKTSSDDPTFEETTHKDLFNTAFSQTRGYDYYTKPTEKTKFAGGFATAGVFYDFNIPNQHKSSTTNLA